MGDRDSKFAVEDVENVPSEPSKGGFFSESAIHFFRSPNLTKKYSKKLS